MKCRILGENGIEVALSREEMQELDITFDALDYANSQTRRVLWTVLDEAGAVLGKAIDLSGKMLIEAQSDGSGGCILDFKILPMSSVVQTKKLIKKEEEKLLFETDQADILLSAVHRLPSELQGDLYMRSGRFRLVLCPSFQCLESVFALLCEFGTVWRGEECKVAETEEYWTFVSSNAVAKINDYICRPKK